MNLKSYAKTFRQNHDNDDNDGDDDDNTGHLFSNRETQLFRSLLLVFDLGLFHFVS